MRENNNRMPTNPLEYQPPTQKELAERAIMRLSNEERAELLAQFSGKAVFSNESSIDSSLYVDVSTTAAREAVAVSYADAHAESSTDAEITTVYPTEESVNHEETTTEAAEFTNAHDIGPGIDQMRNDYGLAA